MKKRTAGLLCIGLLLVAPTLLVAKPARISAEDFLKWGLEAASAPGVTHLEVVFDTNPETVVTIDLAHVPQPLTQSGLESALSERITAKGHFACGVELQRLRGEDVEEYDEE